MKQTKIIKLLLIVIIVFSLISGCTSTSTNEVSRNDTKNNLEIHFLDVGQADSILILMPYGEVSLIDGGNIGDGDYIINYIRDLGIDKIDYLIATHPHEDHIGGLPSIISTFKIGEVFMPQKEHTTNIFNKLIDEIKKKDIKINSARSGIKIVDREDLDFLILSPISKEYDETNNYSIVSKLTYRDTSFLFTGDAEKDVEKDIISKNLDLSADLLKVGHHGGNTSTSEAFLDKVKPKYGVISVGKDNEYGHPTKEVLERLQSRGISIFRTDELGTIKVISNGNNITINKKSTTKNSTDSKEENKTPRVDYYIGNKNTKVYHEPGCNSLPDKKNQIILNTKEEAEKQGFRPHISCVE